MKIKAGKVSNIRFVRARFQTLVGLNLGSKSHSPIFLSLFPGSKCCTCVRDMMNEKKGDLSTDATLLLEFKLQQPYSRILGL